MDSKKKYQDNANKWSQLVAKTWQDPHFKKELLAHSDRILREYGIDLSGKKAKIVENNQHEVYFILPQKPEGFSEKDLKNINAATQCMTGSSGSF